MTKALSFSKVNFVSNKDMMCLTSLVPAKYFCRSRTFSFKDNFNFKLLLFSFFSFLFFFPMRAFAIFGRGSSHKKPEKGKKKKRKKGKNLENRKIKPFFERDITNSSSDLKQDPF